MPLDVQHNVPAETLHSLKLSGEAHTLVDLSDLDDIKELVDYATEHQLKIIPLGEGSNLVFPKQANILWLRATFDSIEILEQDEEQVRVQVGAGLNWHQWVSYCLEQGWYGLENLALIPGTVGAAPIQNIGAYGVEVKAVIESVELVYLTESGTNKVGDVRKLSYQECDFAYRESIFKKSLKDKVLICSVTFRLAKKAEPDFSYQSLQNYFAQRNNQNPGAHEVFEAVVAIRSQRLPDPNRYPNAGSFFKNPIIAIEAAQALQERHKDLPLYESTPGTKKLSAAWLIEQAGLKGYRHNGIAISQQHALVLTNISFLDTAMPSASSDDIQTTCQYIIQVVKAKFGIELTPEPRIDF